MCPNHHPNIYQILPNMVETSWESTRLKTLVNQPTRPWICRGSSIMACAQMRLPDSMAQYKGEIDWVPHSSQRTLNSKRERWCTLVTNPIQLPGLGVQVSNTMYIFPLNMGNALQVFVFSPLQTTQCWFSRSFRNQWHNFVSPPAPKPPQKTQVRPSEKYQLPPSRNTQGV